MPSKFGSYKDCLTDDSECDKDEYCVEEKKMYTVSLMKKKNEQDLKDMLLID